MESIIVAEDFEDLYENAPCGYLSFLSDGLIIKINQTLLTWLGLERSSVISKKKFQDLISVGEQIFFETQVSPLLRVQRSAEEIQFNLKTKTETRLPVLTSTKQVSLPNQDSVVNRMTLFNISDRKKFESELIIERKKAEAAAKQKSDFLSMLSHEIRTPLNAVIGITNLLESTKLSAEQEPFMEMLKSSSDNLLNLLNSILDLSKINAGKVVLEKKEFQLRKFAESNVLAWQGLAQKKGLKVSTDIDPAIPDSAIGDPVKLSQILTNLLGNAVKFTKEGFVTLRVKLIELRDSEMVLNFEVQDSGIGIAPDKLALIFEEFSQADSDTGAHFGGTGLGLAISQRLANLNGTRINVESSQGIGSKFSLELTLPIGDPNIDTHRIERVANLEGSLTGLSVLVVDDSRDNIELMKHLFRKWGAVVETARNGSEALARVKAQYFDVVLMDVRMPVMNGYLAALAIRALPDARKSNVPIIAFSGSTTFDGHDIVNEDVFQAVLGKPFKPVELVAKLLLYTKN